MNEALSQLDRALRQYFGDFAAGKDVPPARRFFLEGYMHALCDANLIDERTLRDMLMASCREALGEEAAQRYASGDALVLHSHMRRAPVYPSA